MTRIGVENVLVLLM